MKREAYRRRDRSLHKKHKLKYMIPPYPISGFIETLKDDDNLFMFLSPCAGKIKDITLSIGTIDSEAKFYLDILKKDGTLTSQSLSVGVGDHELDYFNADLERGDKASFYIKDGGATDIWYSCNFIPVLSKEYIIRITYTNAERLQILGAQE